MSLSRYEEILIQLVAARSTANFLPAYDNDLEAVIRAANLLEEHFRARDITLAAGTALAADGLPFFRPQAG
jgi:hypothetical protein